LRDRLLRIGSSLVQHGPDSDRVYVMRIAPGDVRLVLDEAESLATRNSYGKIVVKARASDFGELARRGYRVEAVVPRFHEGGESGLFAGKFLEAGRATPRDPRIQEVVEAGRAAHARALAETGPDDRPGSSVEPPTSPAAMSNGGGMPRGEVVVVDEAGPEDLDELAACYAEVFESYPFPIEDPAHLRAEREHGTRFFTARDHGRLVGASSMEPAGPPGVVEMTDFATLPSHRKRGIATDLLALMGRHAREAGVRVAYTIARAGSFGMNITFGRRGYRYAGTLINNTWIGGAIESMNVWYKILEDQS
jgi:beta-lysine N6-acetyltransferase